MAQISLALLSRLLRVEPDALSVKFIDRAQKMDLSYLEPTRQEVELYIFDFLKRLDAPVLPKSNKKDLALWENGWQENLSAIKSGQPLASALRPRYFRGSSFLRFRKNLVVTENRQLEYDLLTLVRIILFENWVSDVSTVCELGCGTGHNLVLLSEIFPEKELIGCDWTKTSQVILSHLAKVEGIKLRGENYDMLEGNPIPELPKDSAILTIHAMEQLGQRFGPFLARLCESGAKRIVHLEPIIEFYDPDNLYDKLACDYTLKRNYLNGFLTELRRLEAEGKLEIIAAFRPEIGGVFHESSIVVWEPR